MDDRFKLEQEILKDYDFVIGVDEVGRGPLAGPVVAAAVSFDKIIGEAWWEEIKDSKKVSQNKREILTEHILSSARTGIGIVSVEEIEKINILQASLLAMKLAVNDLVSNSNSDSDKSIKGELGLAGISPYLLIDGNKTIPNLELNQQAIVRGDSLVHSIAAASILAKVTRDNLMQEYDKQYPNYNFAQHKGYGTIKHIVAIKQYSLSPIHRPSFCQKILK